MFSLFSGASPTVFPELETVKDAKDCPAIAEKAFKRLLEFESAEWSPLAYEDAGLGELNDIKIFDRVVPDSTVSFGKATGTIPLPPKTLFEKFWEFNVEWVKTFDPDMKEFAKLLNISEELLVVCLRANAPFPVAPREFVTLRGRKEVDGTYYIYSTSVNYDAAPVDATYVRGVIPANGLIFKPVAGDPNKTHMVRVTAIDPKGAIPLWVINMVKTKAGDYMGRMRAACAK